MKITKKITLAVSAAILSMSIFSACSGSGEKMSKMISKHEVSITGVHASLLSVDDSVKVMLTNPSGEDHGWQVQLVIPMSNEKLWKDVEETYRNASTYFEASMRDLDFVLLDDDGAEIDYNLHPDWDAVKSILASNEYVTQDVSGKLTFQNLDSKPYKEAKAIYDRVAGVAIKNAELTKIYRSGPSSSSSASSSSSYDDDLDDLEKAIDANKKSIKAASKMAGAANSKDVKKALDAYNEALDAYGDMLK